jgi:poly(3-hydroxybutyrate) depolymerase
MIEEEAVAEEAVVAAAAEVSVAAAAAVSGQAVQEKCIKQPVQTANRKRKYLLYHPVTDRCTAGIATRSINQQDIKFRFLNF